MPTIRSEALEEFVYRVLRAVETPEEDARIVAQHIVGSDIAGHESHGVMALPGYMRLHEKGYINTGSPFEIVKDEPAYAIVDGHRNFGHVVAHKATELAIEKARKTTISCVAFREARHIGRLGGYVEMIAKAGMFGFICCASGGVIHTVAPYGGTKGRTGTNPIAMAIPSGPDGRIILLDMATIVHAAGKMRVYQRQEKPFPDDWLLDKEGQPTTDPNEFGAFRPVGGDVGYKGYGLLFFVEILSGILTRDGYSQDFPNLDDPMGEFTNGSLIIAINNESFLPLDVLKKEVLALTDWIKSSPTADGFDEILYPGEPEERSRKERLANGIAIDDTTWESMEKLAEEFKLEGALTPIT